MIQIWENEEIDFELYQEFIDSLPNTLVYYTTGYLKLVAKITNAKLGIVVYISDQTIQAALPFCTYDGPLGKVINSLPFFGSHGGVITRVAESREIQTAVVRKFLDFCVSSKCVSATIVDSPFEKSFDPYEGFVEFNHRDRRISLITKLEPGMTPEDLIATFDDPRPRNIRKAINSGVKVEEDNSEFALEFLQKYHSIGMKEIGGTPKKSEFFLEIRNFLHKKCWKVYTAKVEDNLIGSLLILYSGKTAEYFVPVTRTEYRSLQPLSLMIFTAMQDAIRNGYRNWNWGGTWSSQKGVFDFKKKWAAEQAEYKYYCAVFKVEIMKRDKDFILENYPNFYVVPFNKMESSR